MQGIPITIGTMDEQKMAQFLNLLTGKAFKWATAVWEKGGELTISYEHFIKLFRWVSNHSLKGVEVSKQLPTIKQGSR